MIQVMLHVQRTDQPHGLHEESFGSQVWQESDCMLLLRDKHDTEHGFGAINRGSYEAALMLCPQSV